MRYCIIVFDEKTGKFEKEGFVNEAGSPEDALKIAISLFPTKEIHAYEIQNDKTLKEVKIFKNGDYVNE